MHCRCAKIMLFNILCPVLLDNTHLLGSQKQKSTEVECDSEGEVTHEALNEDCIAEALRRTSKAIHDIDALISATTLS